jgi:hypothetical protein
MPTGLGATFVTQPFSAGTIFNNADGTTAKQIYVQLGGPSRVFAILLSNTDATARTIDVFVRIGATNFLIGSVTIPAGTGVAGVPPKEFFEALNLTNLAGFDMTSAATLQASMESAITAPNTVTVVVVAGQY